MQLLLVTTVLLELLPLPEISTSVSAKTAGAAVEPIRAAEVIAVAIL